MSGPLVLGLTGSIGMGKSTVAAMFAEAGVPVFDADAAVHRLQGPGGPVVAAIEAAFPGTTGAGGVDRPALAAAVLGDEAAMKRLEAIVHPPSPGSAPASLPPTPMRRWSWSTCRCCSRPAAIRAVDRVAVVSAASEVQRARVLARPGLTEAKLAHILARQLPSTPQARPRRSRHRDRRPLADTRAEVGRVIACLAPLARR